MREELALAGKGVIISCPNHVISPETLHTQAKKDSEAYMYIQICVHSHTQATILTKKRLFFESGERCDKDSWEGFLEGLEGEPDNPILIKTY